MAIPFSVKAKILTLLGEHGRKEKTGIILDRLIGLYEVRFKEPLDIQTWGFSCFTKFIMAMPNLFRLAFDESEEAYMVHATSEKSSFLHELSCSFTSSTTMYPGQSQQQTLDTTDELDVDVLIENLPSDIAVTKADLQELFDDFDLIHVELHFEFDKSLETPYALVRLTTLTEAERLVTQFDLHDFLGSTLILSLKRPDKATEAQKENRPPWRCSTPQHQNQVLEPYSENGIFSLKCERMKGVQKNVCMRLLLSQTLGEKIPPGGKYPTESKTADQTCVPKMSKKDEDKGIGFLKQLVRQLSEKIHREKSSQTQDFLMEPINARVMPQTGGGCRVESSHMEQTPSKISEERRVLQSSHVQQLNDRERLSGRGQHWENLHQRQTGSIEERSQSGQGVEGYLDSRHLKENYQEFQREENMFEEGEGYVHSRHPKKNYLEFQCKENMFEEREGDVDSRHMRPSPVEDVESGDSECMMDVSQMSFVEKRVRETGVELPCIVVTHFPKWAEQKHFAGWFALYNPICVCLLQCAKTGMSKAHIWLSEEKMVWRAVEEMHQQRVCGTRIKVDVPYFLPRLRAWVLGGHPDSLEQLKNWDQAVLRGLAQHRVWVKEHLRSPDLTLHGLEHVQVIITHVINDTLFMGQLMEPGVLWKLREISEEISIAAGNGSPPSLQARRNFQGPCIVKWKRDCRWHRAWLFSGHAHSSTARVYLMDVGVLDLVAWHYVRHYYSPGMCALPPVARPFSLAEPIVNLQNQLHSQICLTVSSVRENGIVNVKPVSWSGTVQGDSEHQHIDVFMRT